MGRKMDLRKATGMPQRRAPAAEGLDLVWRSVSMVVPGKKAPKTVLHGLSGEALAGTVTAIMGPVGGTSIHNMHATLPDPSLTARP